MTAAPRTGFAEANGLQLYYEDHGDVLHPALVLVMGLSAQLTLWPDGFVQDLVARGYRVIRFDNRDIGLSTACDGLRVTGNFWWRMARAQLGLSSPVPYTLHDMTEDVRGLLDFLQIPKVHLVGASMGGMIAQLFAAKYPERLHSLGIVFSSTNQPLLPPPHPSALKPLITGPGKNAKEADILAHGRRFRRLISGPVHTWSDTDIADAVLSDYRRSYRPAGIVRQFNAILGTGSLRAYTKKIRTRTVVIHGANDPLLPKGCGRAVHRAIAGSTWVEVPGMGHDLPPTVWPVVVDALVRNAQGRR